MCMEFAVTAVVTAVHEIAILWNDTGMHGEFAPGI